MAQETALAPKYSFYSKNSCYKTFFCEDKSLKKKWISEPLKYICAL